MAPLVRRSWARRGKTPILFQCTRSHQKVSIIAAICVNPRTDRIHLYFRLHPDENINADSVISFLRQLLRQVDGPIILIWDRLMAHRAAKVRRFIDRRAELQSFFLPPYAPELNPVENVWGYLKMPGWARPSTERFCRICTLICSPRIPTLADDIHKKSRAKQENGRDADPCRFFLSRESLRVSGLSVYATITHGARLPFVKIRISR
jgi:transposase